ncbi:hypothetical protein [Pseudomonas aeruginosa]|uniref:hypothetical protein n=2 Tax=Gammaproteobacteria TaxID=1236 RepID=UPI00093723F7|nr:hypothetical protein [Pseudomonas aeruginosa]HCE6987343.1 hypothetical protein [Pseudomonas aeruginosa]
MSRFLYTGPDSAVTLKVSDGKGNFNDQDVLLWNDQEVELPADHDLVRVLVQKGRLTPVQAAPVQVEQPAATSSTETTAATEKSAGKTK